LVFFAIRSSVSFDGFLFLVLPVVAVVSVVVVRVTILVVRVVGGVRAGVMVGVGMSSPLVIEFPLEFIASLDLSVKEFLGNFDSSFKRNGVG
jgi:hypothetical protein